MPSHPQCFERRSVFAPITAAPISVPSFRCSNPPSSIRRCGCVGCFQTNEANRSDESYYNSIGSSCGAS